MRIIAALLIIMSLGACQSTESRTAQLEGICAQPYNRQVGQFHYRQCQGLYPLSDEKREEDFQLGRVVGD